MVGRSTGAAGVEVERDGAARAGPAQGCDSAGDEDVAQGSEGLTRDAHQPLEGRSLGAAYGLS